MTPNLKIAEAGPRVEDAQDFPETSRSDLRSVYGGGGGDGTDQGGAGAEARSLHTADRALGVKKQKLEEKEKEK